METRRFGRLLLALACLCWCFSLSASRPYTATGTWAGTSNADTVTLSLISGQDTTYCIDSALIDFDGVLTSASICQAGNPSSVIATALNGFCVDLTASSAFNGPAPELICLIHCFNNSAAQCDTTYLQVVVLSSSCDQLLQPDTIAITFAGLPMPVCIPLAPLQAIHYDLWLDDEPITQTVGCDFDSVVVYSYGLLPGNGFSGPYQLVEWKVDGVAYSGFFNNVNELAAFMNFVDPTGQWQINLSNSILFGGNPDKVYGNMLITHLPTGSNAQLSVNYSFFPKGMKITIEDGSTHLFIAHDPATDCTDTIVITSNQFVPSTDTIYLSLPADTPSDTICLSLDEVPGGLGSSGYCLTPHLGQAPLANDSCIVYQGYANTTGLDTFCVLLCNDGFPQVCDTTVFFVEITPVVDTLKLTLPAGATQLDTCLAANVLELTPPLTEAFVCQQGEVVSAALDSTCLTLSNDDFSGGTDFLCLVHCNDSFCDTTIVELTIEPLVCDTIFDVDTLALWLVHDTAFYCMPVPVTEIGNYTVCLDGDTLTGFAPCGSGGSQLVLMGSGTHLLTIKSGTLCADSLTIVATPFDNNTDTLHFSTFVNEPLPGICTPAPELLGQISQVSICSPPVHGALAQVSDTCFSWVPQTNYTGTDTACVVFCDDHLPSACDTFIFVLQTFQKTDTLHVQTFENIPSTVVCADTTTLQGGFSESLICQQPDHGNLLVSGNCFTYNPLPGYIGQDTACLLVCDPSGICDTSIILIEVDSLCSKLLWFVHDDTLSAEALDCIAKVGVCIPLAFDSLGQWGILDNDTPIAPAGQPCNGSFASFSLDTGFHVLTFTHLLSGCTDSQAVVVTCPTDSSNCGIHATTPLAFDLDDCNEVARFCTDLEMDALPFLYTTLDGVPFDDWQPCSPGLEEAGLDLGPGQWQLVIADTVKGCADTFDIAVNCPPPCPVWFPTDTLVFTNSNCAQKPGRLCLPLTVDSLSKLSFTIDDIPYSGPYLPCLFDTLFNLLYSSLPGGGLSGPYIVENWQVNGVSFNGQFNTAQELANLMSLWDALANWSVHIDPQTQLVTIQGGHPANTYSGITIRQQSTGVTVTLGIGMLLLPQGAAVPLPQGTYALVITDPTSGCSQSATGIIACVTSSVFADVVLTGDVDTLCINGSELPGGIDTVFNACPGSGGQVANFVIVDSCLLYLGLIPGQDSACVVACNDFGICDTTFVYVTVVDEPPFLDPPIAVKDSIVTGEGQPVVVQVLQNDTIDGMTDMYIVDEPSHGEVFILTNDDINYVPNPGYCNDQQPDSFSYAICNPVGCDTALVLVVVRCSELTIFNGFSPNGDGINDTFTIYGLSNYPGSILRIFNRWGNLVFEATDYQNDWNGKWEGKDLPDGTYFYLLDLNNGAPPLKGQLTLLR